MKISLLAIAFVLAGFTSYSQDSSQVKRTITLKGTFNTPTNSHPRPVYIVDVNDTAVVVMETPVKFRGFAPNAGTKSIPYHQIEVATINRKGAVGRGIMFGGLGGMVVGGIIGAITYKPCDPCFLDFGIGFDILAGSSVGLLGGGLIGAVAGILSKKIFKIGRNKQQFETMRLSVLDRAYK